MEPKSVAPMTKMQTLAMAKFRFRNGWRSSSGNFARSAWSTKPNVRPRPRTKPTTTDVLVKLPVVPTSDNAYRSRASPGESRQKPSVSNGVVSRSSVSNFGSQRLARTSETMPIGTLM